MLTTGTAELVSKFRQDNGAKNSFVARIVAGFSRPAQRFTFFHFWRAAKCWRRPNSLHY